MHKIIYKVKLDQSPETFDNYFTTPPLKRRKHIPIMYRGDQNCTICGSVQKPVDAIDEQGKACLLCVECDNEL